MSYLSKLDQVLNEDLKVILHKEKQYGGSWKKRGGVGAYMMLARKWDRLENIIEAEGQNQYDIFEHVMLDQSPEGVLDDIRDLRRYLALVEAEILDRIQEEIPL